LGSPAPQAFGGPDSTFGLRKNFGAVARSSCFAFCFFALVALFRCSLLLLLLVSLWLCCSIASRLACCLARVRWLGLLHGLLDVVGESLFQPFADHCLDRFLRSAVDHLGD
jgi:hypothetical protein